MRAVGQSLVRRGDPEFLTGRAIYVADLDLPELADAAHVVFIRSPHAHARVLDVSVSDAVESEGVVAVVTASDTVQLTSHLRPFIQPLFGGVVRYVGEPVAAVVAESYAEAVDAAELVDVDFEVLPAVLDPEVAKGGGVLLFPELGTNIVIEATADLFPTGHDADRFAASPVVIRQRVVNPRQAPSPIEPRSVAATWRAGHIHLWASTQRPHAYRDRVAEIYGLDLAVVHVIAGPNVGGAFGGKGGITVEEQLMPLLAERAGRPVRWTETRTENQTAATQGRGETFDVVLAGDRSGLLESIRIEVTKDCGAYRMAGAGLPTAYTFPNLTGPYVIPHVEFASWSMVVNAVPVGAFRGAGRGPLIDALECAVDQFAAATGIDPTDVRRRNLVPADQMPYRSPTGAIYDEADYLADMEQALERAGYDALRAEQKERRAAPDARQLGIGVAAYNHRTNGAGTESARVEIQSDGSAVITTGTTSQGHGHDMTWAQIAADVLKISIDRIDVVEGITDAIPTGVGAVGSRSIQTAGVAVFNASETVLDLARNAAARFFEADAGDIRLDADRGVFHVVGTPSIFRTWGQLAAAGTGTEDELACGDDFAGPESYPSGCHVAVVEVDIDTGKVTLRQFVAVDDAGPRVNPAIVEGQLHGGIASGVGQALGEAVAFDDDGNPITSNFMDYPIVTIDQLPLFDLAPAAVASSFNPKGFKGVGESGTIGAAAAVHLAVLDALRPLGVDHLDMPCTPLRVWEALRRAE